MAHKDGSKSGGRKAGTPNKSTEALRQKARELEVDPFEIMLLFAKGDWEALGYKEPILEKFNGEGAVVGFEYVIPPAVRLKAAAEAIQYIEPKRKSIDVKIEDETDAVVKRALLAQTTAADVIRALQSDPFLDQAKVQRAIEVKSERVEVSHAAKAPVSNERRGRKRPRRSR